MLYNTCSLHDWRQRTVVGSAGVSLKEQVSHIGGSHRRLTVNAQSLQARRSAVFALHSRSSDALPSDVASRHCAGVTACRYSSAASVVAAAAAATTAG